MLTEFKHGVLLEVVLLSKVGKFTIWEFLPESASCNLVNTVLAAINKKEKVGGIFFDSIFTRTLLVKLYI
jgi:hypothetical protein